MIVVHRVVPCRIPRGENTCTDVGRSGGFGSAYRALVFITNEPNNERYCSVNQSAKGLGQNTALAARIRDYSSLAEPVSRVK